MILRIALFALMALGLAGFGAVAWVSAHPPAAGPAAAAPPAKAAVLVAARELRAGSLLKADDLAARELSVDQLPAGVLMDGMAARRGLVGAMVRRGLAANDLILPTDVMRPGDHGFLAAVLAPGMRAATIGVDAVTGSAGLIWPGDRVDVIMTESIQEPGLPPGRRVVAETVLRDVRVIAIDQQLVEGATPDAAQQQQQARTVTVEVSGEQAERLEVAVQIGRLSLAVRAADSAAATSFQAPAPVWASDVSQALASAPKPKPTPNVLRLFQGAADGREYQF